MHEGSFTQEIVQGINQALDAYPKATPRSVHVKIGELLHLEEEAVRLHFGLLAKGTRLEGIELQLEEVPVRVRCRACGHEGPVADHHLPFCEKCQSMNVEMLGGREVVIDSVVLEEVSL